MQIAQLHATHTADLLAQFTIPQLHHLSFQPSTLYPPQWEQTPSPLAFDSPEPPPTLKR